MNTLVKTLSGVQSDAAPERRRLIARDWFVAAVVRGFPPVLGFVLFVLAWQGIATAIPALPTPAVTWKAAVALFADPFYRNGPNDQGVGWNVLASLARVGAGFGMAAVIGIPAGFLIGRFAFLNAMASPIISLLRPVSPLAWLPLGLVLFLSAGKQASDLGALFTIAICAMWPTVLNTAVGVRAIPQDYLNVAKVLKLSRTRTLFKVLLPATLPYMFTGFRLSLGIAWLVIVAAEMLTGRPGVGGFLWQEYNALNYSHIILCILTIGVVGYALDRLMSVVERRFKTA